MRRGIFRRSRPGWWIALGAAMVAAVCAPRVWRSRFVTQRRAARELGQARLSVASRDFDRARVRFRAALRLEPFEATARHELADMELGLGNWELAFLELESQTAAHPEDARAFTRLAELMLSAGMLEAPEAALDRAVSLAPNRADARSLRADIRFRLGRYSGALADAQAAVATEPKDSTFWRLVIRASARSRGIDGAKEAARRATERIGKDAGFLQAVTDPGPEPAPPRRLRADAQIDFGTVGAWMREHWQGRLAQQREALEQQLAQRNWAEAERVVESARRAWPDTEFPPFLAGILALARDDDVGAEKQLSEALAMAPRFPTFLAALARTWARKSGASGAGERLMQLAEADPGLASARYMAARAYIEARDPIRAEAALTRGLELQRDSPVPYQHLADYYFGVDRAADALVICQRGIEKFPDAVDLQLMLAQISAALRRPDDAIGAYDAVLSRRPDLDLARYKLGTLLASGENAGNSRPKLLEVARELAGDRPSDPLLLDALGWILFRANQLPRGRELLEAAVKGAPEEPAPHFHLAVVYTQQHRTDAAERELKAALGSERPFPERLDALRLMRENSTLATPKR